MPRANTGPAAWRLVEVDVAKDSASFTYRLRRDKLREVRRREGRYLLRTNLPDTDPARLWKFYLQRVAVEEAFKNLKGDLALRPIIHQHIERTSSSSSSHIACMSRSVDACMRSPRV